MKWLTCQYNHPLIKYPVDELPDFDADEFDLWDGDRQKYICPLCQIKDTEDCLRETINQLREELKGRVMDYWQRSAQTWDIKDREKYREKARAEWDSLQKKYFKAKDKKKFMRGLNLEKEEKK